MPGQKLRLVQKTAPGLKNGIIFYACMYIIGHYLFYISIRRYFILNIKCITEVRLYCTICIQVYKHVKKIGFKPPTSNINS